MILKVRTLTPTAVVPTRAYADDAAFDLYADEEAHLAPGVWRLIRTGIAIEFEPMNAVRVLGRSGLASRGVWVHHGLVDAGYRGEVMVNVYHLPSSRSVAPHFDIYPGDRIAQLMAVSLPMVELRIAQDLTESERGERGHGSSG